MILMRNVAVHLGWVDLADMQATAAAYVIAAESSIAAGIGDGAIAKASYLSQRICRPLMHLSP